MNARNTAATLLLPLMLPAALEAQQGGQQTPPTPRTRVTRTVTTGPLTGRCAELTSSPTMLLQAPEGRALMRYKLELDDAAGVIEQRGDANQRVDIQRITQMQRGVDSLMRVFVRFAQEDGHEVRGQVMRRVDGDSIRIVVDGRALKTPRATFESVDGTIRLNGQSIEATIRSLQPQIAAFSEVARTHLPLRASAPTGWLGMHLSESKITMMSPEGALTNYCDYPVVEAVDAGSPAEKAGVNAGDTVVAYNGRDVRAQAVNYAELLVPGNVLRMRVKRASRLRELAVTVAARPQTERNIVFVRSGCAPGMTCDRPSTFSFSASGAPSPAPTASVPTPPAPPIEAMLVGTGMAVLAGAQLSVVDEEFAQSLGVEPGVLVLRVPVGTPAADGGLRPGDVIRAVNGAPVRDMTPLRRALGNTSGAAGSREVRLTVSSKGAGARIVTVRW